MSSPFDKMADQAALNRLVYSSRHRAKMVDGEGRPLRLQLQPAGSSFTQTIGIWKGPKLARKFAASHMRDGLVLNSVGGLAAVVHQYDRTLLSPGRDARSHRVVWKGCYPGLRGLFADVGVATHCADDIVRYAAVDQALTSL